MGVLCLAATLDWFKQGQVLVAPSTVAPRPVTALTPIGAATRETSLNIVNASP